jgi:hypothetical protein
VKHKADKNFVFSYICTGDDDTPGAAGANYYCHTMKCKNMQAQEDIVHAVKHNTRTIRSKRDQAIKAYEAGGLTLEMHEPAITWWNSSKQPMFHYSLAKRSGTVSGVIRAKCQSDGAHVTEKKVRMDSTIRGMDLVELLAEKFNMSDINISEWAVWYKSANNEEVLDDVTNPIIHSLQWKDPSDGDFVLKRLPKGFARVGGSASPGSSQGSVSKKASHASLGLTNGPGSGLGPQLPYNDEDEDLLLSVMITRQSGSGLGFKLTPAYLLQMCIHYSYLNKEEDSLKRLLAKIVALITKTVAGNAGNPEVLLFWASNALKLLACFSLQKKLLAVYKEVAMGAMEQTVTAALENMLSCKRNGVALPSDLASGGIV